MFYKITPCNLYFYSNYMLSVVSYEECEFFVLLREDLICYSHG